MAKGKGRDKRVKRKKVPVLQKGKDGTAKKDNSVDSSDKNGEELTLLEKVQKEYEEWTPGKGRERAVTRMAFFLWMQLPVRYRGAPDAVMNTLGIDGDLRDLARIESMKAFGEVCHIGHGTLTQWRREFEESDEGKDTRKLFRRLSREMVGALYRKGIEHGDAERFKVYMQYVEGWMPGINIGAPGDSNEMDSERRAALDKLLQRNLRKQV